MNLWILHSYVARHLHRCSDWYLMPPPTVQQYAMPTQPHRLPPIHDCRFCGAKRFLHETPKFCCCGGKVFLYPIGICSRFEELYSGTGPESAHFLQYIKPCNDFFAFTSMGVYLDPILAKRTNGIYTFRAQGQIYHFIDSLYPSGEMPSHLQLMYLCVPVYYIYG